MINLHPRASLAAANRVLIITGGLLLAIVGWFGFKFAMGSSHIVAMQTRIRFLESSLAQSQQTVRRLQTTNVKPTPSGIGAVPKLQTDFESAATAHKAELREFHTSTAPAPYLDRFANDTKDQGWQQIEIKATLNGELSAVMACLQDLSKSNGLFEFDSLEFSRESTNKDRTTVSVNATFRALTKEKKTP